MTILTPFNDLAAALNEESWEWLQDANGRLARALAAEVERGATSTDIRRFVQRHTGRERVAARMEQAAAHLIRQREQG